MAGGVITRSNHPDALWPGVEDWWGKSYSSFPQQWSMIFEKKKSNKAYEKVIETTGFGYVPVKAEGASVAFDSDYEGVSNTFTNVTYGLGYIVTREEMDDDLYAYVSKTRVRALSRSQNITQETVHANVLNRAFNASFPGGDAVALCSNAHPTISGNQSNLLTAADFSETSLEDGLKQIAAATDARGLLIALQTAKLVVSRGDMFNATRILKSELRTNTANNDINAVKSMGIVGEGVVNNYLTDQDAWFLQTDAPDGLISMRRREMEFDQDNDFDTENAKAKSTIRYSTGWGDFRGVYGNAGA